MDNKRIFRANSVLTINKKKEIKVKDNSFAIALIIVISTMGLFFGILVATINYYSNFIPSLDQLEKIQPELVTQVFDRNGGLLKEYFIQKREIIPIDSMPNFLVNGLVAVEDRNFYSHWGVDVVHGIFRSIFYQVIKSKSHGGSTITQQLARNLFLTREHTIARKIKEAITAYKIEKTYTKKEIIQFYLNQVNLGGAYGVQAATKRYYSKDIKDLSIDEAAIFIGMLKAPNSYRPDYKPKRSKKRRDVVLKLMLENGVINQSQYDSSIVKPIKVNPYKSPSTIAPYFLERVRVYVAKKYGENALYTKGLKIYTTINPKEQIAVEKSMTKNLRIYQKEMNNIFYHKYLKYRMKKAPKVLRDIPLDSLLYSMDTILYRDSVIAKWIKTLHVKKEDTLVTVQGAFLATDKDGGVRAFIGGRNFKESEFNRVYSKRQPGSAFKPFIYLTGLMKGFTPSSILLDQPIVIVNDDGKLDRNGDKAEDWRPGNHGGKVRGPVLYIDALTHSMNLATIYLLNKIKPHAVIKVAENFGLNSNYEEVPALALGVFELSLWQLVRAYSVFQNGGKIVKPYFISRIEDKDGKILEEHLPESRRVISPEMNYVMGTLLRSVISRGTGFGAIRRGFLNPAGGKTGTTNASADNWFLGYTKQFTAGCWVGTDMKRKMGRHRTGASTALPIWTDYMLAAHDTLPKIDFKVPRGVVFKNVCAKSGKLATKNCNKIYYNTAFLVGTQPKDSCPIHGENTNSENLRSGVNSWDINEDNSDDKDLSSGKGEVKKEF